MRILVALEDDYRLYREMIAAVLPIKRKDVKVESTTLEALEEEFERFDPQVIICSGKKDVKPNGDRVWIELSLGTALQANVSAGVGRSFEGRSFELANPTLEELLEVIDEFA